MIGWMLLFSLPFSESLNVLNPLKNKKIKKFRFFFFGGGFVVLSDGSYRPTPWHK